MENLEEKRVLGQEGFDRYWEAESLAALFEVAEGDGGIGLVEDFADYAGAEAPFLVTVDDGVEERVFSPGDL